MRADRLTMAPKYLAALADTAERVDACLALRSAGLRRPRGGLFPLHEPRARGGGRPDLLGAVLRTPGVAGLRGPDDRDGPVLRRSRGAGRRYSPRGLGGDGADRRGAGGGAALRLFVLRGHRRATLSRRLRDAARPPYRPAPLAPAHQGATGVRIRATSEAHR